MNHCLKTRLVRQAFCDRQNPSPKDGGRGKGTGSVPPIFGTGVFETVSKLFFLGVLRHETGSLAGFRNHGTVARAIGGRVL